MSHALSAIDLALRGDAGGLSFLEQTASIYVLDAATTPGNPTTYGWWNFLNDALNEVERFERESLSSTHSSPPNLDAHVRLLATITRRVARRPPASDRRLIGTCLANASMNHMNLLGNEEMARSLLRNNDDMRERDMGRIASIVFDFSFHRARNAIQSSMRRSAFSDPMAMEQLCGVVAANAVSTGPKAVGHLVTDWIVPSIDSFPPFAVVAILSHIAEEAMGKGRPAGTKTVIKALAPSVFKSALGPLLIVALRESDAMVDDSTASAGGNNMNHRISALALRALESWCKVTSIGMVQLRQIFSSTNVNILEGIADALYSDAESVIDAVSDILDTLLQQDTRDANANLSLTIAQSVLGNTLLGGNQLAVAQQLTGSNERARVLILSELVSAIGLQRFRFSERQSRGDTAVCRCLARTAGKILLESQDCIKNGMLQVSLDGLFDLLFKATAHPSVYVCGIALEALSAIAPHDKDLSTRVLPLLQGKAIIPFHLIGAEDDAIEGLGDYRDFRERVLKDALIACHAGCGSFYLESCASAIEEFCLASPSPHLPYQLEAALFCMVAVSGNVVKKFRNVQKADATTINADSDAQVICSHLEKIVPALAKNSFSSTSHPLVMAKMCRFLNEYAICFPQCQSSNVFEAASELALSSFNRELAENKDHGSRESSDTMSPLSEACNALQKLLCSSPSHFSAPTAMSALESAWKMPYACKQIAIEDRESLCSGLCFVIASMPSEQWSPSLEGLAQPIISCLSVVTKEADHLSAAGNTNAKERTLPLLKRLSNEILLLSSIVRFFNQAEISNLDDTKTIARRNALISLLHKSWPCLKHVAERYSSHEDIAQSIGQILLDSLCLYKSDEELPLIMELVGLAKTSLSLIAKSNNPTSIASLLPFAKKMIEMHGHKVETSFITNEDNVYRGILVDLIMMSYEAVSLCPGPNVKNGNNGSGSPQSYVPSPDIISPMFATLSCCAKHCPKLLISLARDGQPMGEIIRSSVEASPDVLKANEVEVATSSIEFLKVLVTSLESMSVDEYDDSKKAAILSATNHIKTVIKTDILASSVASVCGVSPQEVISPMTELIYAILACSQWGEVEGSISAAINSNQFKLGDEIRSILFEEFKKCTVDGYPPPNFESMIADLWNMHQTDDTGAIAGGDTVLEFAQKYSALKTTHIR